MLITIYDLALAQNREQTNEIVRGSEELLEEKIEIGREEVRSYLNRYDFNTMLGDSWQNAYFKQLCVNVIQYHLVQLGLPGLHYEIVRERYEDAVKYLEKVQRGQLLPDWPLRPDDSGTPMDEAGNVQWKSNPKRGNHY